MSRWQLELQGSGRIVVERLTIADGYWSRLAGLQFRRPLPPGDGLLLVPCASIHTMWMRFAIDAAMLDRAGKVLAIRRAVRPGGSPSPRAARAPSWKRRRAICNSPSVTLSSCAGSTSRARCRRPWRRFP